MRSEQKVIPFPASAAARETQPEPERSGSVDRRNGQDRRRHTWRTITYCGLHGRGRRRNVRREGHNYYLDWYEPRLVLTGLGLFLFSCLDALFTLTLLDHGAYEANVFMARLLQSGIGIFVITKIVLTGVGVLFLLMHSHFRLFGVTSGKRALQWLLGGYALLLVYEVFLLTMVS